MHLFRYAAELAIYYSLYLTCVYLAGSSSRPVVDRAVLIDEPLKAQLPTMSNWWCIGKVTNQPPKLQLLSCSLFPMRIHFMAMAAWTRRKVQNTCTDGLIVIARSQQLLCRGVHAMRAIEVNPSYLICYPPTDRAKNNPASISERIQTSARCRRAVQMQGTVNQLVVRPSFGWQLTEIIGRSVWWLSRCMNPT